MSCECGEHDCPGEMNSLLTVEKTGLIVVDVQEKLWPQIHDKDGVGKRIVQAIEVAGHLNLPIVVAEQYVKGLGNTIPEVKQALENINAFHPIEKVSFSCFGEPTLAAAIERTGVEAWAVLGIETHVCVMQTALQALDQGYEVFLIGEATGSRDPAHKEEALARLKNDGAIVGSVEMLGFELLKTSKNEAFRAVQRVIV